MNAITTKPVAVMASLLAITACSPSDTSLRDVDEFLSRVDLQFIIEEARSGGASQQQLAVLEEAHVRGELQLVDLEELFVEYVECLESSNFVVEVLAPVERYPGLLVPDARMQPPPGLNEIASERLDYECATTHYLWADVYYISQPVAMEAYLETFDTQRESIVACLKELGHPMDLDASSAELLYAVTESIVAQLDHGDNYVRCWEGDNFSGFSRP